MSHYFTVARESFYKRLFCGHEEITGRQVQKKMAIKEPRFYRICLLCGRLRKTSKTKKYRNIVICEDWIYVEMAGGHK